MPTVEGLTPDILWYTLVGIVGIGAIVVLADKVADVFRKKKARQELERIPSSELADSISAKVLEKLEPRFEEIDRKLAQDKCRIDAHERQLAAQDKEIGKIEEGQKVMCRGILALLSHDINGNSKDKLEESRAEITNYLIER